MDLYWKNDPDEIEWFERLMVDYSDVEWFQPSPDDAPWHVQGFIAEGVLLNVWPHTEKAMVDYEPPSVSGEVNVRELIERHRMEDLFDVFE